MQARVRKYAHFLERSGLALAGAACGLFVAVHVGSSIPALTSQIFLILMMIGGAIGFYLGIDTPALEFPEADPHSPHGNSGGRIDTAELLSSVGTFLATLMAFISVIVIVLRQNPHIVVTIVIMLGWVSGVAMQVVAGALARRRASPEALH